MKKKRVIKAALTVWVVFLYVGKCTVALFDVALEEFVCKNRYLVFRKKIFANFQKFCRQIVLVDLIKFHII